MSKLSQSHLQSNAQKDVKSKSRQLHTSGLWRSSVSRKMAPLRPTTSHLRLQKTDVSDELIVFAQRPSSWLISDMYKWRLNNHLPMLARSSFIDPERIKSSFRWDFGGLLLPSILRPELLSPRTAMQVFVLKVLAVGDIKLSLNHSEPDFGFALIKVFAILWNFHEKHGIDEVPFFTHEVSSAQSSEQQNNY